MMNQFKPGNFKAVAVALCATSLFAPLASPAKPGGHSGAATVTVQRAGLLYILLLIAIFMMGGVLVPVGTGFAMDTNASPFEIADTTKPAEGVANKKLRDPFWPIGYMKVESEKGGEKLPVTNEEWKKARSLLRGGGVVKKGNKYYATVNGMMVKAGDVIAVEVDGKVFKFRVRSINMQGIKFDEIDQ